MSQPVTNIQGTAEAEAVANIVRDAAKPEVIFVDHPNDPKLAKIPLLYLPARGHVEAKVISLKANLDEYRERPEYREGVALLGDVASFIEHTRRFMSDRSVLFASPDPKQPSLTSVLDYHAAGAESAPSWGAHQGHYEFPLSDEWKRWTAQAGRKMGQADFAEFLDSNITDIADPGGELGGIAQSLVDAAGIVFANPPRLLELSRGLSVREASTVKQAFNLGNGEVQLQYNTEHQDERGQPIKVPTGFLVALPVFRGDVPYKLPVRLRYRVADGRITWFFELFQADRVFDHAFKEACSAAQVATGLPLFVGSPE